jgi:hypothetical protein
MPNRSITRGPVLFLVALSLAIPGCGGDPPAGESSILGVWEGSPTATSTHVLTFDGSETSGTIELDQSTSVPALGAGCVVRSVSSGTFARALDGSSIDLVPTAGEGGTESCDDPSLDTARAPLTTEQLAAGALHGTYELADGILTVRATHPLAGMIELRYERVE